MKESLNETRDARKEGYSKGGFRKGGRQERRYAGPNMYHFDLIGWDFGNGN